VANSIDKLAGALGQYKSVKNPRATSIRHHLWASGDWYLEQLCHLDDEQLLEIERIMKRETK